MRSLLATVTFAVLLGAPAAQAEKRIFIVANNADGYGVDRCLASGAELRHGGRDRLLQVARVRPGTVVPQGRQGRDHRRDPDQRAGACRGGNCDEFVAIDCKR